MDKDNIGKKGEEIAAKFLKNKGFEILEMNYKNDSGRRLGEIDIIAKEKDELVFAEIKTRDYQKYKDTLPEENITHSKLRKLSKIASQYLYSHKLQDSKYRFDSISVWIDLDSKMAKIKHIRNIFL